MNYRKVNLDLSQIPKKYGKFDWIGAIGCVVPYQIDGTAFNGNISIEGQVKNKLMVSIDNSEPFLVCKESFVVGQLAKRFGSKARIYKYSVGDTVNNLEILEQIVMERKSTVSRNVQFSSKENGYIARCPVHQYTFSILERDLNRGSGCPICGHNRVVAGINDIATENPQLFKWFVDPELATTLSKDTNKMVKLKCPNCSREFMGIPNRYKKGTPSCVCQDGISYPEKLFASILNQLKISYIYQLNNTTFSWCQKYKYDFYFKISGKEYIVELDGGLGHGNKTLLGMDAGDAIRRDQEKNRLAKENHVHLIRIDAFYPDIRKRFSFLWNNIINSELKEILDLDLVDQEVCKIESEKSLVVEIGKLWDDEKLTVSEIMGRTHLGATTVEFYLKKGKELGINNYVPRSRRYTNPSVKKYLKVEDASGKITCVHHGISDFQQHAKALIGRDISSHAIHDSLRKGTFTKSKLKFSYATQSDYEAFIQTIREE